MALTPRKPVISAVQTVAVKQKGIALMLVLMLTGVLSAVIIFQQYRLQHRLHQAEQLSAYIDAQLQAITAREQLIYTLSTSGVWFYGAVSQVVSEAGLPANFNFHGTPFQLNKVQVRITDSAGMVSLLPFNPEAWQAMFQFAGVAEPQRLTDELADWIDTDDFIHLNGAERGDYAKEGLPRNDIPQSIDELAMLRSMTPQLWKKIRPHVVYIGEGQLNVEFAPDALLPVLLGDERAKRQISARKNNEAAEESAGAETGSGGYPSRNLYIEIVSRSEHAAYKESFVLVRGVGTTEFSYITAYRPGYGDM